MDLVLDQALWAVAVVVPPLVILSGIPIEPKVKIAKARSPRSNQPGDAPQDAPKWRGADSTP